MGKTPKTLIKVVVVLLVLLVVGGVVFFSFGLNRIVETAIRKVGPRVTKTSVEVGKVKLTPFGGNGRITGLKVGNPEGFKTDSLFVMDDIEIDLDLSTLASDTVVINRVFIDTPQITYEQAMNGTNLGRLLRNLKSGRKDVGGDTPDVPAEAGPDEESEPKKFVIKRFELAEAKVRMGMSLVGSQTYTLTLPDIVLEDVGEKSGGVTAAEILVVVLNAVSESLADTGGDATKALETGTGLLDKTLKSLDGSAGEGGSAGVGDMGDELKESAASVRDGLKGFLGSGKDGDE
jgi:hypothetical protein